MVNNPEENKWWDLHRPEDPERDAQIAKNMDYAKSIGALKPDEYEIEEALAQPYNADDINPVEKQDKSTGWAENTYYDTLLPIIEGYEGFRDKTYIPTKGDKPTIGYGHTGIFAQPGATVNKEKARELLKQDARERTEALKSEIPSFETLPLDLAVQLGQSAYRGGITGSPKTIEHINAGQFQEASKEFLDNDEYRDAVKRGRPGIRKRMEAVSGALSKPGTGVSPAANMTGGTL